MPLEESIYPIDWLRIAERDLKRVDQLLDLHDPNAASFYLQQAVEKFLKSFLLSKGWKLKRIHDLDDLIDNALKYDSALEEYRSVCEKVTSFYLVERYPFVANAGPTEDDVRQALAQVQGLVKRLRNEIK